MVECAGLEIRYTARYRGFESHPLRHRGTGCFEPNQAAFFFPIFPGRCPSLGSPETASRRCAVKATRGVADTTLTVRRTTSPRLFPLDRYKAPRAFVILASLPLKEKCDESKSASDKSVTRVGNVSRRGQCGVFERCGCRRRRRPLPRSSCRPWCCCRLRYWAPPRGQEREEGCRRSQQRQIGPGRNCHGRDWLRPVSRHLATPAGQPSSYCMLRCRPLSPHLQRRFIQSTMSYPS